jgi:hypothetical protein
VRAAAAAAVVLAAGSAAQAEIIYATTQLGVLVSFDSASPGNLLSGVAISGLAMNEQVRGIDFRPADGRLYAVGSLGNIYTLNVTTGAASQVSTLSEQLNGSNFGTDFNPTVDRLRVVSSTNQNLRVNVDTGAAIVDGTLAYGPGDPNFGASPSVVHAGYTNSVAGATSTQLFVIDSALDALVQQNPANAGTLTTIGALGVDATEIGGFDISGATGTAFLIARGVQADRSVLTTVNLQTGAATTVGEIGGGVLITGLSVVPTPGSVVLLAMGGVVAARRRR